MPTAPSAVCMAALAAATTCCGMHSIFIGGLVCESPLPLATPMVGLEKCGEAGCFMAPEGTAMRTSGAPALPGTDGMKIDGAAMLTGIATAGTGGVAMLTGTADVGIGGVAPADENWCFAGGSRANMPVGISVAT